MQATFFLFFITLEPRVDWLKRLPASNTSPHRNHRAQEGLIALIEELSAFVWELIKETMHLPLGWKRVSIKC